MVDVRASAGYRSLRLDDHRNCGAEVIGPDARPLLGAMTLRGFPFEAGDDPARCFVGVGSGLADRVTLPIGATANNLLFAWRLLESPILEGGPVGTPVADLRFRYTGGSEDVVTVRDRFEIALVPPGWGQNPFRAVSDTYDSLPARYEGPFASAGSRQTEAQQGFARRCWIWAWRNTRPDERIDSLEIAARGPSLVISGITLGEVDENPLRLPGARTLRIDVDTPDVAERHPLDLEVTVDRGVSTFTYSLPSQSPEDALRDPLRGFGEPVNWGSSPAYVRVASLPSGTLTVRSSGADLGSVPWAQVEAGEAVAGPARIRLVDPGRNWVRTEILDAATGRPVACRVHFRSPDGVPYAPYGHHSHVGSDMGTWHVDIGGDVKLGRLSYAYVDGACEGWLPRGEVIVDVARGFEYEPLRTRVTIEPGQRRLALQLTRLRDMNAERWFSGDTHVHFLSTQGAQTEARGEDLNVVNLLLSQWGHLFTNTEEFTGAPLVSRDGRTVVYATQENRQHFLGHLTLLGLKEQVMPWCSDGPSEAEMGGTLEITMSEWADRCHAQGGTVVLPHIPNPNGEPAAMIATGRIDAVEFLRGELYNHAEYYRYLNGGYRLPLVGGTDKMTADVPVGLYRTYVRIPEDEEFTYESWCRNLARGRTFLSGGPLLFLRVEGAEPGDVVHVKGGGTVEVEVVLESIFPVHTLQLVRDGEVVASTSEAAGARRLQLRERVTFDRDGWLAARAGGPSYLDFTPHRDVWERGVMAHTSPVYVTCGDEYRVFGESTVQYMLTMVDGALTYINEVSTQEPSDSVTHHHGHADHLAHLTQPFLEARAALEERLRSRG